jgi:hypothetical protein
MFGGLSSAAAAEPGAVTDDIAPLDARLRMAEPSPTPLTLLPPPSWSVSSPTGRLKDTRRDGRLRQRNVPPPPAAAVAAAARSWPSSKRSKLLPTLSALCEVKSASAMSSKDAVTSLQSPTIRFKRNSSSRVSKCRKLAECNNPSISTIKWRSCSSMVSETDCCASKTRPLARRT